MNREELVRKLEIVSPALADNDLLPVLTHFCFTGKQVVAFNDQIAIAAPLDVDGLVGGIPGKTLLALLRNSQAKDATIEPDGTNIILKMAKAKVTLPILPKEAFIFETKLLKPEGNEIAVKDWKQLVKALGSCLLSVGTDTSVPDQLGVTIIPDGKTLQLFATNNHTLSYATVSLTKPAPFKQRVILPASFCRQVMAATKEPYLEINKSHALLTSGKVTVFGRLLESDMPIQFMETLESHAPEKTMKALVTAPGTLKLALDRAVVITEGSTDKAKTLFQVQNGELVMISRTQQGEVIDRFNLNDHPDVKVRIEPKHLRSGLDFADQMMITPRCVVLAKGTMLFLVSAHGG